MATPVGATTVAQLQNALGTSAFLDSQFSGLAAVLDAGGNNQPATGHFYQADGATINRFNDRSYFGAATVNNGNYALTGEDWLQNLIASTTSIAQLASLSQIGNIAILGGVRSSDAPPAILDNYAGAFFGINDNTSGQANVVTTLYVESRYYAGANQSLGCEMNIIPQAGAAKGYVDPYFPWQSLKSAGLWLSCGRPDVSSADASVALMIENNSISPSTSGRYDKGIVFDANAIVGTSASVIGGSCAIAFAAGHQIQWFNSSSQVTAGISCSAVAQNACSLTFTDASGAAFTTGVGGALIFAVLPRGTTAEKNFFYLQGGNTGSPTPALNVAGTDANIDLLLAPKGTGRVQIGTGSVAAGTPANFVAQRAIPIKDAGGTVYWVPVMTAQW